VGEEASGLRGKKVMICLWMVAELPRKKQWVPWRLPASLIGKNKEPFPAAQNQAIIFFVGEFFE